MCTENGPFIAFPVIIFASSEEGCIVFGLCSTRWSCVADIVLHLCIPQEDLKAERAAAGVLQGRLRVAEAASEGSERAASELVSALQQMEALQVAPPLTSRLAHAGLIGLQHACAWTCKPASYQ